MSGKKNRRLVDRRLYVIVLAACVNQAHAQSSVTLYGELDTGVTWLSNVANYAQYKATSGLIDGSYWGVQGLEDLGGGNKAVFRLERGFAVTNGQLLNDHPYYIGLGNERYGTITLGHQYDAVHDYFAPFTLTGGAGGTAFAHPFDNDNANNSYLARNSIKYTSAQFAGFSAGGMYAFSNAAGQFANNRAYSVGANYQNGPFNAGAAYLHVDGRGRTATGAYGIAALPGSNRDAFNAIVGAQNAYGVGVNYALGDLVLGAAWSRATYTSVADADTGASARSIGFSNYEVNGVYQLMPTLTLAGLYTYTKASDAHWHQGAVQLDYALSKRTDTYVEAIYQRASAGVPAMINTADPASGGSQLLIAAGVRHRF